MKIYDETYEDELPTVSKGPARESSRVTKHEYIVNDGDTQWTEWLSREEVSDYHRKGYSVSRVYWFQFWR